MVSSFGGSCPIRTRPALQGSKCSSFGPPTNSTSRSWRTIRVFWDKAAEAVRSHRRASVQEPRPVGVVPEKTP